MKRFKLIIATLVIGMFVKSSAQAGGTEVQPWVEYIPVNGPQKYSARCKASVPSSTASDDPVLMRLKNYQNEILLNEGVEVNTHLCPLNIPLNRTLTVSSFLGFHDGNLKRCVSRLSRVIGTENVPGIPDMTPLPGEPLSGEPLFLDYGFFGVPVYTPTVVNQCGSPIFGNPNPGTNPPPTTPVATNPNNAPIVIPPLNTPNQPPIKFVGKCNIPKIEIDGDWTGGDDMFLPVDVPWGTSLHFSFTCPSGKVVKMDVTCSPGIQGTQYASGPGWDFKLSAPSFGMGGFITPGWFGPYDRPDTFAGEADGYCDPLAQEPPAPLPIPLPTNPAPVNPNDPCGWNLGLPKTLHHQWMEENLTYDQLRECYGAKPLQMIK